MRLQKIYEINDITAIATAFCMVGVKVRLHTIEEEAER